LRSHAPASNHTAPLALHDALPIFSQHLANPVLTAVDVDTLEALHAHLGDVAARWDRMDAICAGLPRTLVHGDFNSKNLLMQSDKDRKSTSELQSRFDLVCRLLLEK